MLKKQSLDLPAQRVQPMPYHFDHVAHSQVGLWHDAIELRLATRPSEPPLEAIITQISRLAGLVAFLAALAGLLWALQ